MAKTVLNVKIEPDLKRRAQALAAEMGLPMSTVVAAGLRMFVSDRSLTFQAEPQLDPQVADELTRLSDQARSGHWEDFSPEFASARDAIAWLEAETNQAQAA